MRREKLKRRLLEGAEKRTPKRKSQRRIIISQLKSIPDINFRLWNTKFHVNYSSLKNPVLILHGGSWKCIQCYTRKKDNRTFFFYLRSVWNRQSGQCGCFWSVGAKSRREKPHKYMEKLRTTQIWSFKLGADHQTTMLYSFLSLFILNSKLRLWRKREPTGGRPICFQSSCFAFFFFFF